MRNGIVRNLLVLTLAVALLSAAPAGFARYNPNRCDVCSGAYDPVSRTSVISCGTAGDMEWGSNDCHIQCSDAVGPNSDGLDFVACICDDSASKCLSIVVTPYS